MTTENKKKKSGLNIFTCPLIVRDPYTYFFKAMLMQNRLCNKIVYINDNNDN